MGASADVVNGYLDALTNGDLAKARGFVADDFSFIGPMLQAEGIDAFFYGAGPLPPMVRGYTMLRQWEDDEDVCSVYEFKLETPAGAGTVLMSEWTVLRGGKLASSRLGVDTAALQALMPT